MVKVIQGMKALLKGSRKKEETVNEVAKKVFERKKVYFLDITAMIYYAGPLYGCFLVDSFKPKYIIPGENNTFVTDEQTLKELQTLEDNGDAGIYAGYTLFISRNFVVIPEAVSTRAIQEENYLKNELTGSPLVPETKLFAHTIGSLFHLYNEENLNPVLVTYDSETVEIAQKRGFEIHKTI